ncbi:unnamed protein product [Brachionus calyciflorus]|uniref:Thioredoxin-like protein 1 n=1 Tax=Brachionus calyciflorus TaxID=104777 RepID=A0A814GIS0_9BILA|nr:unnamed protein product [Brachionus calyciflorus]
MSLVEISSDATFAEKITDAGSKLVVIDFFATWCGPCNMIAPFFKQLTTKYPNAVFLKVDVDKCPGTAAAHNVSAMPTFLLFKQRVELARIRGADKNQLENKIKEFYTESEGDNAAGGVSKVDGDFVDLVSLINKAQSECLNQSDDFVWENALSPDSKCLKSDVDEQILMYVSFQQPVKLSSLVIQGPADNGPKNVRLFINQTKTLDFDSAQNCLAVQDLELKPEDLKDGQLLKLRFVKFQNVQNITIFFVNNQSESEVTQVDYIRFIGSPVNVTNMSDFKRVSGQAGESHG